MAEGVVFGPVIIYGNEDDEVNSSCEEHNEPGERKKPGFNFPGKRIEEEYEGHPQERMKTGASREEMDYFDIIDTYNIIRRRG